MGKNWCMAFLLLRICFVFKMWVLFHWKKSIGGFLEKHPISHDMALRKRETLHTFSRSVKHGSFSSSGGVSLTTPTHPYSYKSPSSEVLHNPSGWIWKSNKKGIFLWNNLWNEKGMQLCVKRARKVSVQVTLNNCDVHPLQQCYI